MRQVVGLFGAEAEVEEYTSKDIQLSLSSKKRINFCQLVKRKKGIRRDGFYKNESLENTYRFDLQYFTIVNAIEMWNVLNWIASGEDGQCRNQADIRILTLLPAIFWFPDSHVSLFYLLRSHLNFLAILHANFAKIQEMWWQFVRNLHQIDI